MSAKSHAESNPVNVTEGDFSGFATSVPAIGLRTRQRTQVACNLGAESKSLTDRTVLPETRRF